MHQRLLAQVLSPLAQQKQCQERRPNAVDRTQGKMEIYINQNGQLSTSEARVLKQLSIMQASDIMLVQGAAGCGKTTTSFHYLAMALQADC